MSAERSVLVAVPGTAELRQLAADIASAAARAEKADPGDRSDVIRYEALCVQLEGLAAQALLAGAESVDLPDDLPEAAGISYAAPEPASGPGQLLQRRIPRPLSDTVDRWVSDGRIVLELRLGLENGQCLIPGSQVRAPEPASRWEAPLGASGRKAVEGRFRAQLQAVVTQDGEATQRLTISPSGVHNRVITEVLRDFVRGVRDTRTDAPVTYRDGSQAAHPFPLRCLALAPAVPAQADMALHLALLSIRHTEMDAVVDGAWLRNAEVSRPRSAAQTDDFVYETSRKQLDQLTRCGSRTATLHIYQTGLDTAVVGFYRAVVCHLLDHPYTLNVAPMFYAAKHSGRGSDGLLQSEAQFEPGEPWTMGEQR